MKKFILFISLLILSACSNLRHSFKIDSEKYQAIGKDSRIKFIILHYTALNDEKSIKVLTTNKVSSHYLITSNDDDPIYSLVPDTERAWHAGVSNFDHRTNINDSSIGIEIVNLGYNTNIKYGKKYGDPSDLRPREHYYPYTPTQIEKIAFLVETLKNKYNVDDKYIIAHSDIAPQRKQDPGPLFPWKHLYYDYGLGNWYNEKDKTFFMNNHIFEKQSILSIKNEFKKYGYDINETEEWDAESMKVIYAFQMHFRPEKIDGIVDLETYAIIKALNKKY